MRPNELEKFEQRHGLRAAQTTTVYTGGGGAPAGTAKVYSGGSHRGAGGAGAPRWPISTRRIAPATDLASANVAYAFALAGDVRAVGVLMDRDCGGDLEASADGNTDWLPLAAGAVFPLRKRGTGKKGRRVIWLRRRSTGSGLLVLAGYDSLEQAAKSAGYIGGQSGGAGSISLGNVAVDELPAAAALADNTANPTVSGIGAYLMGWDGALWDRVVADTGALRVNVSAGGSLIAAIAGASDGQAAANALVTGTFNYGFNGTTWDRTRTFAGNADAVTPATLGLLGSLAHLVAFDGTNFDRLHTNEASPTIANKLAVSPGTGAMTSLSAAAANGAGTAFDLGVAHKNFALQVTEGGTVTTGVVTLEGSVDGTNYFTLGISYDAAVDTSGDIKWTADRPVIFVRANLTVLTGGGNVTATITAI